MTTRRRALIVIVAATVLMVVVLYGSLQWILLRGFAAVEQDNTVRNVQRAVEALNAELGYLNSKASDWANWDDTYEFMEDGNSQHVESNLTDESFVDLGLNLMLFIRPSGQVLAGKSYDLASKKEIEVSSALKRHLSMDGLLRPADNGTRRSGLLLLPEGPLAIVSRPILTSKGTGPSRGTLLMGRYVDAALVDHLARTTHLALDMYGVQDAQMPADMQALKGSFSLSNEFVVWPRDGDTVAGYTILNDLYGQPALLLRVTTSRPIYQQGQATMNYILATLVAVGLVFGSASLVLVDRLVRAWQAHKESEERYALAVRGANDGVWDWNLLTQTIYYSPRWKSMLGLPVDAVGTSPEEWFDRIHPDDRSRVKAESSAHLAGQSEFFESEFRMQRHDGEYLWVHCRGLAVRREDGVAYRMAGSLSDITPRKRAEEQVLHDAFHDALTGLPNRALFDDRLGRAIERGKRANRPRYAVLYLDFDRFKVANDSFGHTIGDKLLFASAQRLQLCLRSMDTVARLGGDEFVILLEDVGEAWEATRVAERIQAEIELPFDLDGHKVFISTSIGVVLGNKAYERTEQVLRDADIAMYRAKSEGRARFAVFDDAMRDRAMARLQIEGNLRGAIERHEFEVHYQPILRLDNDQLIGFEALVRWRDPERGLIPPGEFVPVAEENGLIIPLGDWVLFEACTQLARWQSDYPLNPPLTVSVNLSPRQFAQPGLPDRIQDILKETGVPASSLRLEITEGAIMEDPAQGAEMLRRLQAMGIEVEIDDFGTGYSSLSYLQQFPISTLKIDRSFVTRMGVRANGIGRGTEIVRTILALAHQLGLAVIAEGVETQDQLARLREMNCEYGQGYLFSKPIPHDQAELLLSNFRHAVSTGMNSSARPAVRAPTPQPG